MLLRDVLVGVDDRLVGVPDRCGCVGVPDRDDDNDCFRGDALVVVVAAVVANCRLRLAISSLSDGTIFASCRDASASARNNDVFWLSTISFN